MRQKKAVGPRWYCTYYLFEAFFEISKIFFKSEEVEISENRSAYDLKVSHSIEKRLTYLLFLPVFSATGSCAFNSFLARRIRYSPDDITFARRRRRRRRGPLCATTNELGGDKKVKIFTNTDIFGRLHRCRVIIKIAASRNRSLTIIIIIIIIIVAFGTHTH